ncbi:MAG TPA: nucleoside triphosphate pyrophosphatase [Myxococcota bacterium]|nr:nucleoside triphosphate pyrophosphatase [Myxococcota bacterium]HRY95788.1 nucleoside triphosphate pyrophosphatase [Myxococcota bacterium]HSA21171.1 nucleoside triphosphate pyrophosphatase [Myxococcota bacterium]
MDAPLRKLVLASTSRYRSALLERLGLPFEAARPPYQEQHDLPLPPEELVLHLARGKARSLAPLFPDALLLAADQVAELDGRVLTKPGDEARAVEQLRLLAGRTHRLLTGVCLLEARSGRLEQALDVQRMSMRPLAEERLRAYVALDRPFDCAGSYRVEGPGIALFERMQGEDFTGIIGLPLTRVVDLLARFDIQVP